MFYTYLHRRGDTGAPFYLGKGRSNRAWSRSSRSKRWRAIDAKHGRTVEILAHWPTEQEVFDHEVLLIGIFRDLGYEMVNINAGGEGVTGLQHRDDTRARMRLAHKALWQDPEHRARMKAARADSYTDERRAEVGAKTRIAWSDPQHKASRLAAIAAAAQRAEVKALRSAVQQAAQRRPESIAKQRATRAANDAAGRYAGGQPPKPVWCVTTGRLFPSAAEAARAMGMRPQSVARVANGGRRHARGYVFTYELPSTPLQEPVPESP